MKRKKRTLKEALRELMDRMQYHCLNGDGTFSPSFVKEWYEIAEEALPVKRVKTNYKKEAK